uniref:Uncharacterized protein n=1 Tax=Arundo donax TaxID=35708 RepID=A0A0A9BAV2_ARUDO
MRPLCVAHSSAFHRVPCSRIRCHVGNATPRAASFL